jgi:hypothetical protein
MIEAMVEIFLRAVADRELQTITNKRNEKNLKGEQSIDEFGKRRGCDEKKRLISTGLQQMNGETADVVVVCGLTLLRSRRSSDQRRSGVNE